MRISTSQIFNIGVNSMLSQQSNLARTQQQVGSGKEILAPSDDPVGTVRSLELSRALGRTEQYDRNANLLLSRLSLEESVLGDNVNILQRIRDLALQANNASQSNESKGAIATEMFQQLDGLLSSANTRDSSGHYIFAGYQEAGEPFSSSSGAYSYNGDDGQRLLQIGPATHIADGDSGSDIYMRIKNGNGLFQAAAEATNTGTGIIDAGSLADITAFTGDAVTIQFTLTGYDVLDSGGGTILSGGTYEEGSNIVVGGMSVSISGQPQAGDEFTLAGSSSQDLFSMVDALAAALATDRNSPEQRAAQINEVNVAIANIDQALDHMVNKQAGIGARIQSVERQTDINSGASLQLQESLSEIQDLDYAEAISRMNQQLLGLQAAQQAFSKVNSLSLFNYL
ncbi:MAG: flagellar hook-associated protein FlgL [Spongiibacteraceae bacterium]